MNRDQALAKIKKCLALSKSTNANEAGIAMRQAQALMAEHVLTPDDVALADINTKECSTRTNSGPPHHQRLHDAQSTGEYFGAATVKDYVIQVSPDFAMRYLAQQSDEDDGATDSLPNSTTDLALAMRFSTFVEARVILRSVVKRYPELQFKLDVVDALTGDAQ